MPKELPGMKANQKSRRSFLTRMGIGVAALASLAIPGAGLIKGRKDEDDFDKVFPGRDSMFHPESDPRKDPRRKV